MVSYSELKAAVAEHNLLSYQGAVLYALQGEPIYQGTVPAHVKARRRAANKVARASRRRNR